MTRTMKEGTFSLLNAQLTVESATGPDGAVIKGFTVIDLAVVRGPLVPMSNEQAKGLIACLRQVERKDLPTQFRFRYGFLNLIAVTFKFKEFDPEWFGGGGVKGTFSIGIPFGPRWERIEMSMDAVSGLRACLERVYGIRAKSAEIS